MENSNVEQIINDGLYAAQALYLLLESSGADKVELEGESPDGAWLVMCLQGDDMIAAVKKTLEEFGVEEEFSVDLASGEIDQG